MRLLPTTPPPLHRVCSHCERDLPADAYGVDNSKRDGLCITCRECRREMNRRSYAKNRDARLDDVAQYRARNLAQISQRKREAYATNPEPVREAARAYHVQNRARICERKREARKQGSAS